MSTVNKHTQGEWKIGGNARSQSTYKEIGIYDKEFNEICRIDLQSDLPASELYANAKIICIAVNNHSLLIEALKDALFCIKSHGSTFMDSYHTGIYEKGIELLTSIEQQTK